MRLKVGSGRKSPWSDTGNWYMRGLSQAVSRSVPRLQGCSRGSTDVRLKFSHVDIRPAYVRPVIGRQHAKELLMSVVLGRTRDTILLAAAMLVIVFTLGASSAWALPDYDGDGSPDTADCDNLD